MSVECGWLGLPLIDHVHCCQWRALLRALPPQSVDMLFADMPYNVTACAWDSYIVPLDAFWRHVRRVMKPRGAVVLTGSQPFTSKLVMSNLDWFRYEWVWDKGVSGSFVQAEVMPLRTHETVLIFGGGTKHPAYNPIMKLRKVPQKIGGLRGDQSAGGKVVKYNPRLLSQTKIYTHAYPKSVICISPRSDVDRGRHPTQKPVALLEYLIRTYTNEGDLVVDPFCGSGTTAVAAANTGRHYIVGDISPEYVETARRRLSLEFGRPAPRRAREVEPLEALPLFAGGAHDL